LHPETPVGGRALKELFASDQLEMMSAHLQRMAKQQGAGEITVGERLPNTRRALAVAEFAREQGKLDEFREAAMSAYWREGRDLEATEYLREVITSAGLDPEAGLAAQDDETYLERVDELRAEAKRAGVNGIPTMFFGEGPVVTGAQPYELLLRAAKAAGATPRETG
jgi:predicted DsbA family dithiol-disulfide isomerase